MRRTIDVLGLGVTAVDEILYVPAYPPADAKVEVSRRERHCGGLCATALVAAARLGARCAFAGTLGQDADSQFVLETLRREKISTRHISLRVGAGPVRSVIVVDERRRSRNIFYDASRAQGAAPDHPSRSILLQAKVLLVDRFGIPGMIRAARLARAAHIPVVADFESFQIPRFAELLDLADHLIISDGFARSITGTRTTEGALRKLARPDRAVVIVTVGSKGCWYWEKMVERARHFPAYRVRAVDTTGCGDVFHGAYAASLAEGCPLRERLRIAAAAAAIKATRPGGQAGSPTRAQLNAFLKAQ